MNEYIEWLQLFISSHQSLEYLIIFLGAAVGGELALFTFGFLTAQGILPIFPVLTLGFLGAFIPNILWFLLGRTRAISVITAHRYTNVTVSTMVQAVVHISRGNHFIAFIVTKFIVGTPVLLIMYANKTSLTFKEFLYYQTPAIALSILIIVPFGFVAGLGFTYLTQIFENLYIAIAFILGVVVAIVAVQLWLKKKLTKIENPDL